MRPHRRRIAGLLAALVLAAALAACDSPAEFRARRAARPDDGRTVTIAFAGDTGTGLAESAKPWVAEHGLQAAFADTRAAWQGADFFVANLEAPIVAPERRSVEGVRRPAQTADVAAAYAAEGVGVFGLANNHVLDFGVEGLRDTVRALDAAHIKTFGAGETEDEAGRPLVLAKDGLKIGLLAACSADNKRFDSYARRGKPGAARLTKAWLKKAISQLRPTVDYVVVFAHWGRIYHTVETEQQHELAVAAARAGADLVVGCHPHLPQGAELIDGVPVLYSLGNFVYHGVPPDPLRTVRDDYGIVARVDFGPRAIRGVTLIPFFNNNVKTDYTPRLVSDAAVRRLFEGMLVRWSGGREIRDGRVLLDPAARR